MQYREVCEAKTEEEMQAKFKELVTEVLRMNPEKDPIKLHNIQLSNIGYIAGYYDAEIFQNVMNWLGTSHPVFGRNYPTPKEAFEKGKTALKG
jgi:chorismate mutase